MIGIKPQIYVSHEMEVFVWEITKEKEKESCQESKKCEHLCILLCQVRKDVHLK